MIIKCTFHANEQHLTAAAFHIPAPPVTSRVCPVTNDARGEMRLAGRKIA